MKGTTFLLAELNTSDNQFVVLKKKNIYIYIYIYGLFLVGVDRAFLCLFNKILLSSFPRKLIQDPDICVPDAMSRKRSFCRARTPPRNEFGADSWHRPTIIEEKVELHAEI